MSERLSDDRLREIAAGDNAFLSVRLAAELVELRATQEHMRARCVWLQGRRKALQRLAATRMVRLRTLRRLKAKLAAYEHHKDGNIRANERRIVLKKAIHVVRSIQEPDGPMPDHMHAYSPEHIARGSIRATITEVEGILQAMMRDDQSTDPATT